MQELVKKGKRPVALFVDAAHDLIGHTLIGLKRLMKVVEHGGGRLSVILPGHPKLRNDLRRATMEEIGYRTDIFTLDGVAGRQREYIIWLPGACTAPKTDCESILTEDALDMLAIKLRTPLQVQLHLILALEAGCQTGETLIIAALVQTVLSRQLDDLEPTLTRHGYRLKDMVEQFDAKAAEIRVPFNNNLEPARLAELRDRMLAAGLPIYHPRAAADVPADVAPARHSCVPILAGQRRRGQLQLLLVRGDGTRVEPDKCRCICS